MGAYLSWQPKAGPAKSLYFDVVTEEAQEFQSTATEHPVEEGVNVTDHVKRELTRVTLEVFVSNHPIIDVNDQGGAIETVKIPFQDYSPPLAPTPGAIFNAVGSAISSLFSGNKEYTAQVLKFEQEKDLIDYVQAQLETVRDTTQLVDIVLPHRFHENMLLEKIEVSRNRGTGSGARITLSFKELRKVQAKLVTAPVPTQLRGQVAKKKGPQPPKAASAPEKKKSLLKGALEHLPEVKGLLGL